MDKLALLYERMKKLRESGVKMKEISEETDICLLYTSPSPRD